MELKSVCATCKKRKFFVRKRTYWVERIKENITTEGKICGKCTRNLAKIIKTT